MLLIAIIKANAKLNRYFFSFLFQMNVKINDLYFDITNHITLLIADLINQLSG